MFKRIVSDLFSLASHRVNRVVRIMANWNNGYLRRLKNKLYRPTRSLRLPVRIFRVSRKLHKFFNPNAPTPQYSSHPLDHSDLFLEIFSVFPNSIISPCDDIDGDGKKELIMRLMENDNKTQGFVFYKFVDDQFIEQQRFASKIFTEFPMSTFRSDDIDGDGNRELIIQLMDDDNNVKSFVFYKFLDGQYVETQRFAANMLAEFPKSAISRCEDIDGDGTKELIIQLMDNDSKIQGDEFKGFQVVQVKGFVLYKFVNDQFVKTQMFASDVISEVFPDSSMSGWSAISGLDDIDGDGKKELIIQLRDNTFSNKGFALYKCSNCQLIKIQLFASNISAAFPMSVISQCDDIDGDGVKELILQLRDGSYKTKGFILYKYTEGQFVETQTFASNIFWEFPLSAISQCEDIDGDGKKELIIQRINNDNQIKGFVLYKYSEGQFVETQTFASDFSGSFIFRCEDIDRDGNKELIIQLVNDSFKTKGFKLYKLSRGQFIKTQTFASGISRAFPRSYICQFDDLDGDGYKELIIQLIDDFFDTHGFALYTFSNGQFTETQMFASDISAAFPNSSISQCEDIDGDGNKELIIQRTDNSSTTKGFVLYKFSDGQFVETQTFASEMLAEFPLSIITQCVDIDGDGNKELLIQRRDSSSTTKGFVLYKWK